MVHLLPSDAAFFTRAMRKRKLGQQRADRESSL